jgi:hypothetical protein
MTGHAVPWALYEFPPEFKGSQDWGPFHGLHDIAPCDDGTLLAVFRSSDHNFPRIYQATPAFDRRRNYPGKIIIKGFKRNHSGQKVETSGWTLYDSKPANRVYKLPIFCWTMIEELTSVLEKRSQPADDTPNYALAQAAGAFLTART